FTFSLQVTDTQVPAVTTVKSFTLVVSPAPLVISNSGTLAPYTLGGGTYGSTTLTATGGIAPYTWAVAPASTLPAGLSLTGNVLSGTPTAPGTFTFSLQVTDSQIPAVTVSKSFTLVVTPAALVISTTSPLSPYTIGNGSYSVNLAATGGIAPYTWSVDPASSLPVGLGISGNVLSGNPTTAGTYTFNLQVTDSQVPAVTTVKAFTLVVSPALIINTSSPLPSYTVSPSQYYTQLSASGGVGSYTWSLQSGSMPPGMFLTAAGQLWGPVTGSGTYTFTIQVTDSQSTITSKVFTVNILSSVLSITTASSLPSYTVSVAQYYNQLSASGGSGSYTWTLLSGTMPPGMSLTATGQLWGPVTGPGTYTFTIQVTDSLLTTASQVFTLIVL
ncbi:putative Ig domain-containing protein, partial [Candidatus Nomurabacteria bacterium]|nr:putative Ig domain-containing protein [Candidatus Nomurabacteria bacterium]